MKPDVLSFGLAAVISFAPLQIVWTRATAQVQRATVLHGHEADEMIRAAASKSTPRTPDGHPDFTGYWDFPKPPKSAYTDKDGTVYVFRLPNQPALPEPSGSPAAPAADPNPPPYKPELLTKVKMMAENEVKYDPAFHCKPLGVPRVGPPTQIVQTPELLVFFYQVDLGEGDATGVGVRLVPVDGRSHRTDVDPMYFGDSIGHWDGDALIVDVTHLTDDTWLGIRGYFHSTALHVVERYTRKGNTLTYEATVEDPKVLTKAWTMTPQTVMLKDEMIYEQPPCEEREETHIINKVHHPFDY